MYRQLHHLCALFAVMCIGSHAIADTMTIVTAPYPPFSYEENGQQKGIAVDLVKAIFTRMHQDIRIIFVPFPRALSMVKNGYAEAIFPFAKSEDRKQFVSYPVERLFTDPGTLFVRADSSISFDGDLSQLGKYSIGMQRDTNHGLVFMNALKTYGVKVDGAIDQEHNLLKLIAGRFDIAVGPRLVVQHAAKQIGKSAEIKILYVGISDGDAYVGFSKNKNHERISQLFDQTIRKMRQDGSYDKIMRSYATK